MDTETTFELTATWVRLTDALDYHDRKWYAPDECGDWQLISFQNVHDLLFDLGIGEEVTFEKVIEDGIEVSRVVADPDRAWIIKQFIYRDQEAHARLTEDMRQAQLRFGF